MSEAKQEATLELKLSETEAFLVNYAVDRFLTGIRWEETRHAHELGADKMKSILVEFRLKLIKFLTEAE